MSEITKDDIFNAGLALRREVLGDEYVDRVFSLHDEFSEAIQEIAFALEDGEIKPQEA